MFKWLFGKGGEKESNTEDFDVIPLHTKYFFVNIGYRYPNMVVGSGDIYCDKVANKHIFNSVIYYDKEANLFLKLPDDKYKYLNREKFISKEEYDNAIQEYNICNCEPGTGHDIREVNVYKPVEEFEEKYKNYIIRIEKITHNYPSVYIHRNDYPDIEVNFRRYVLKKFYHKNKACLKCNTCLSELKLMNEHFENLIKEIDRRIEENKKVLDICKKHI